MGGGERAEAPLPLQLSHTKRHHSHGLSKGGAGGLEEETALPQPNSFIRARSLSPASREKPTFSPSSIKKPPSPPSKTQVSRSGPGRVRKGTQLPSSRREGRESEIWESGSY